MCPGQIVNDWCPADVLLSIKPSLSDLILWYICYLPTILINKAPNAHWRNSFVHFYYLFRITDPSFIQGKFSYPRGTFARLSRFLLSSPQPEEGITTMSRLASGLSLLVKNQKIIPYEEFAGESFITPIGPRTPCPPPMCLSQLGLLSEGKRKKGVEMRRGITFRRNAYRSEMLTTWIRRPVGLSFPP